MEKSELLFNSIRQCSKRCDVKNSQSEAQTIVCAKSSIRWGDISFIESAEFRQSPKGLKSS